MLWPACFGGFIDGEGRVARGGEGGGARGEEEDAWVGGGEEERDESTG